MRKDVVAIIPARGGSKRIPRKNIKDFCHKPLIAYSIEVAKRSELFDDIIVSTDDEEIAKVAREYGASVPFLRPEELSGDFTTTSEVINHAVNHLKKSQKEYKYICSIYATAPLLDEKYLKIGFEKLKNSNAKHCFSATHFPFPIQRGFYLNENSRCEMFFPEHFRTRSQDLKPSYHDAGQFYFTNTHIASNEVMFGKDSVIVELPRYRVCDIDTPEDWEMAVRMYKALQDE